MKAWHAPQKKNAGFTLLEVIIAVAIMAIAFTAIYTSQSSSILSTIKTQDLNMGGFLAHNLMVESEHLMEGKPFSELKLTEEGAYPEPYTQFKWKREVKEIEFPTISFGGASEEGESELSRVLSQTIGKFLSKSLRELVVTVTWKRGEGELKVTLATYLVDLKATFDMSI